MKDLESLSLNSSWLTDLTTHSLFTAGHDGWTIAHPMTQATLPQMIKTTFLTGFAKEPVSAGGLLVLLAASDILADNHKRNQTTPSEFSIEGATEEKQYQEG